MFSLFKPSKVISTESSLWIIEQFDLLFNKLGSDHFYCQAQLILPNAKFFPSTATGAQEMADATLAQIKQQAGMAQCPISIATGGENQLPKLEFKDGFHGSQVTVTGDYSENNQIKIDIDLSQFSKAETLVATLSQQLAAILVNYSDINPSQQQYIALTELLGTFLGFGVMLSNTSYQFKGGCGSCYNSRANRQTGLSEEEMIFSLALFCQLKGIVAKEVLPHLKGYLKSVFKRSIKQLKTIEQAQQLLEYRPSAG